MPDDDPADPPTPPDTPGAEPDDDGEMIDIADALIGDDPFDERGRRLPPRKPTARPEPTAPATVDEPSYFAWPDVVAILSNRTDVSAGTSPAFLKEWNGPDYVTWQESHMRLFPVARILENTPEKFRFESVHGDWFELRPITLELYRSHVREHTMGKPDYDSLPELWRRCAGSGSDSTAAAISGSSTGAIDARGPSSTPWVGASLRAASASTGRSCC